MQDFDHSKMQRCAASKKGPCLERYPGPPLPLSIEQNDSFKPDELFQQIGHNSRNDGFDWLIRLPIRV
jgi:hypothetical protein